MLYYDTRGNLLSETKYMQLLPFNNRRKLKTHGPHAPTRSTVSPSRLTC